MEFQDKKVAVIGAGKMGLPLACRLASNGAEVLCLDSNPAVVDSINNGVAHFEEPGLSEVLSELVRSGGLRASTDALSGVAASDVVIVIVPVILTHDRTANTSIIEAVAATIAKAITAGTMVIFETTLPVGFTRNLATILSSEGLQAGVDFDLVFSPERVKSQSVLENLSKNAKIVGGINERAANRAEAFYSKFLAAPVINVHTLEAAEFAKLAGMVYRDVNIALANELAAYAESCGIDFGAVRTASNTDGEAAILIPGIGVGGHCTPVYPYFYVNDAERRGLTPQLAIAAREINDGQAIVAVAAAEDACGSITGKEVLLLGLGFRPQVKEALYSPAFLLKAELDRKGAHVLMCDPLYSDEEISSYGFTPFDISADRYPEVLVLNTAHNCFCSLTPEQLKNREVRVLIDGRNLWNAAEARRHGLVYVGWGTSLSPASAPEGITFANNLPIAQPVLGKPEILAVTRVIKSGWLMQGKEVEALESEFAQYTNSRFACAVSSGTAALHLALLAAGIKEGDEVITVSHSFIATANSIRYCGATPVFVDISSSTFNMQSSLIENAIGPKTAAILCVHQMGMPCDLDAITTIAQKHGLLVIEDACCALGSEILTAGEFERIGRPRGVSACFSFHPRKLLTTGDGGMITTNDEEHARLFKSLRNHGLINGQHSQLAYNYRLTDIQAAIAREQLQRLPGLIARRREKATLYAALLADVPGLKLPVEPANVRTNWQSFCILLDTRSQRDALAKQLKEQGVDTRPGITCIHREPAYADRQWSCRPGEPCDCSSSTSCDRLQISEQCQDKGLILPLFDRMTDADQRRVTEIIKQQMKSRCEQEV